MELIVDNRADKILNKKVRTKNIDFICTTKKGINKKENEDAFLVVQNNSSTLFMVFDGVGSAKNAKKATLLSKKFIKKNIDRYIENTLQLDLLLYDVNNYLLSQPQKELYTTYTLLFIPYGSDAIYYSSLGDSRLYKMNNQFLEQVSKDDSYSSNIITKCLGLEPYEIYDFKPIFMRKETFSFLLCTDGFYNLMERDKIFYFETFCKKRLTSIKSTIRRKIGDANIDDATLIYVR